MQTYQSIIESDLMTLFYQHIPPGTSLPEPAPRLRGWDDSSPYYKNRPLRGPRGRPQLPLQRKIITFRNVPTMEKITISTLLKEGAKNSEYTHVAGMVMQAITNKQATIHLAKRASAAGQRTTFTQKKGKPIAAVVELQGEQMWHFLSTFLTVVLPKVKDWPGVKARSGDRSGNYGIGIRPDIVGLWPEIAVNYDS
jgi:large subunit ribosomal protein L5